MTKTEPIVYEGVAATLDAAVAHAHDQIPPRPGRDFAVSKVIEWGMQRGGITNQRVWYVRLVEDPQGPFRT